MGAALDALRAAGGWREVTLWVLEQNARGRAFYERMRFGVDGAAQELAATEVRMRATLGAR